MRILHIGTDEKFIDGIIWQFEGIAPESNEYFILVPSEAYEIKYIKNKQKIKTIALDSKAYRNLPDNLASFDAVLMHSLDHNKAYIVNNAPKETLFFWMYWVLSFIKLRPLSWSWSQPPLLWQ
uniref:Uncharacterized protein n=1 Tax=uncultured organism TaxID=155900 RepID=E3T2Z0_9ZZZZ|nr:hypothetical protein [uncultured organism]